MPRVMLQDPFGMCFTICTRNVETTLHAWFDEVLPWLFVPGRPGIDDFDVLWPRITVHPMWAWKRGGPAAPDWHIDSRVLGRIEEFPAKNGDEGLRELLSLRRRFERELALMPITGR